MKKFYDIEIDSQVELENGKTLGKLEESKISVNDGNCSSSGGVTLVEFQLDFSGGQSTIICDKTPEEVIALSAESPVYGVLKGEAEGQVIKQSLGVFMIINTTSGESPFYDPHYGFTPFIGGNANGKFMVGINDDAEWEFNQL